MKHITEAVDFKIYMFNAFQSAFETHHDLDLELQDKTSNPMAFLSEIQGYTMHFHQSMSQEDSGGFVEAVVEEDIGHIYNAHWKLVPIE